MYQIYFYFGMTLYMFRTVFPSIIRSSRLYIQLSNRYCALLLAGRQQYLFDICLLLYVQFSTPDDGWKDRPKHVQCHSKLILNLIHWCILTAWCRVLLEQLTGLQLVKKFPAFHGTRKFITAITSVHHLYSWLYYRNNITMLSPMNIKFTKCQ